MKSAAVMKSALGGLNLHFVQMKSSAQPRVKWNLPPDEVGFHPSVMDLFCYRQISLHLSSLESNKKMPCISRAFFVFEKGRNYTPARCKRYRLVLCTTLASCEPPRSNLHSLAYKQACSLASSDYLFEFWEYRLIKCCTKFAPKSPGHSTLI